VTPETPFGALMREMGAKGIGATAVVDADERLVGIFTAGDLRRHVEKGVDLRSSQAGQIMNPNPRTIGTDALAVEAAQLMEQYRVTLVFVVDEQGRLRGAVNANDLLRAKVI
jgi:arabinose-5-phosphate isomerase